MAVATKPEAEPESRGAVEAQYKLEDCVRGLCTTCTLQTVIVNVLSVLSRWGGERTDRLQMQATNAEWSRE